MSNPNKHVTAEINEHLLGVYDTLRQVRGVMEEIGRFTDRGDLASAIDRVSTVLYGLATAQQDITRCIRPLAKRIGQLEIG